VFLQERTESRPNPLDACAKESANYFLASTNIVETARFSVASLAGDAVLAAVMMFSITGSKRRRLRG